MDDISQTVSRLDLWREGRGRFAWVEGGGWWMVGSVTGVGWKEMQGIQMGCSENYLAK